MLIRLHRQALQSEIDRKAALDLTLEKLDLLSQNQTYPSHPSTPDVIPDASTETIIDTLTTVQEAQNLHDREGDVADLRNILKHTVEAKDDMEMFHVLQIKRDEILEAKETLQRALDTVAELEDTSLSGNHDPSILDPLDKEFMQSGVESLH